MKNGNKNSLLDMGLLKKAGIFGLISAEIIGFVGGGFFLGKMLDNKLHSEPVFSVLFACLGLGYCVWRILQISKKWFRDSPNSDIAKNKE